MNTLLRTLAILAAALLVVAGLFAFRQTSYGQSLASTGHDRGGFSQAAGASPEQAAGAGSDATSAGVAGSSRSGSHGFNRFAAVELLKNLAIVAVSVTLITLGTWMVQRGRRDGPAPHEPLAEG